jgi:phosphinothricin acetyltransferase
MRVRLATIDDVEPTRAIYNLEVTESTVTFDLIPRSSDEQRSWLTARSGGFASLSPFRDRPAYSTTVENSVYVRRDQRGKGVGKVLLAELVALATSHGFHAMVARIVGDHEASIALHRSLGFEVVGTEREVGRKFGRWLDVLEMQLLL